MPNNKLRQRHDLLEDAARFYACVLGKMWYATNAIANKTGLTKGQVSYILHRERISLMAGRNMETPESQLVEQKMRQQLTSELKRKLLAMKGEMQKRLNQ